MHKIFKVIGWTIFTLALGYIAIVIYAYPHDHQAHLDKIAVAKILALKITFADVNGSNLPPNPDPALASATVSGIDANDNGIRDDVELAIFSAYPASSGTSTSIRAAELQYAMDIQTQITKVTDTATWIAATQQVDRAYGCFLDVSKNPDTLEKEVEDLVLNTKERTEKFHSIEKYVYATLLLSGPDCDISV